MMGGCCGGWGAVGSFGAWGLIFNLILSLIVIGGVIWLVVWLVRRNGRGESPLLTTAPPEVLSPKEMLQLRYARGEINREEYLSMLKDLEEGGA